MKNLTPFLKRFNEKGGVKITIGLSPQYDWKVILISTFFLIIVAIALGVYMFIMIDKGDIFSVQSTEGQNETSLDEKSLKEIINYYSEKSKEFNRVKTLKATSTDPSL